MTLSSNVLALLAERGPMTQAELMEATGLPYEKVHNAICTLARNGFSEAAPVRYSFTHKGFYRLNPKQDPTAIARAELTRKNKQMRNAKYREAKRVKRLRTTLPTEVVRAEVLPKAMLAEEALLAFEHRLIAAPIERDELIAAAVARRPALQAAWGAPA